MIGKLLLMVSRTMELSTRNSIECRLNLHPYRCHKTRRGVDTLMMGMRRVVSGCQLIDERDAMVRGRTGRDISRALFLVHGTTEPSWLMKRVIFASYLTIS